MPFIITTASGTTWDEFLDEVLPSVPGCSQAMAIYAIRNAAIDFCHRSLAWIYNPEAIDVVADQMAYPFVPPTDAVVVKVLQAWHDGDELVPATPDDLNGLYRNWRTVTGTPLYSTQDDERNLLLVPTPDAGLVDGLTMRVALKPTISASGIEFRIYEEYRTAIAAGALSKLMMMPKKPYSDPELAAFHLNVFEEKIVDVRNKVLRGYGRARQRNKPHFF